MREFLDGVHDFIVGNPFLAVWMAAFFGFLFCHLTG